MKTILLMKVLYLDGDTCYFQKQDSQMTLVINSCSPFLINLIFLVRMTYFHLKNIWHQTIGLLICYSSSPVTLNTIVLNINLPFNYGICLLKWIYFLKYGMSEKYKFGTISTCLKCRYMITKWHLFYVWLAYWHSFLAKSWLSESYQHTHVMFSNFTFIRKFHIQNVCVTWKSIIKPHKQLPQSLVF